MIRHATYLGKLRVFDFTIRGTTIPLLIAPGVYEPDQYWSMTFLEGATAALQVRDDKQTIVEVGVGSGVAPIYLQSQLPTKIFRFTGLDINPVACEVARLNVAMNRCSQTVEFRGGASLLSTLTEREFRKVDVILANLPQIPTQRAKAHNLNDYYPIKDRINGRPDFYQITGLGLLQQLLTEAPKFLAPGGTLVCTISGRCGENIRSKFFAKFGGNISHLMTQRIPQDANTSIASFARVEKIHNLKFNFFTTSTSPEAISATAAFRLQKAGEPIFHDLMVVSCSL
jgi:methylase of polypeptide subunit release factors